jgi:hypothetical protein
MAETVRAEVPGRPDWNGLPEGTWESRLLEAREGVIDIGSHSVRLVVYAGGGRVPIPILNGIQQVEDCDGRDRHGDPERDRPGPVHRPPSMVDMRRLHCTM